MPLPISSEDQSPPLVLASEPPQPAEWSAAPSHKEEVSGRAGHRGLGTSLRGYRCALYLTVGRGLCWPDWRTQVPRRVGKRGFFLANSYVLAAELNLVFLWWQIPEEHDLESQIRKEREWRFLRNARVRKQAQQLIQKGEGRGRVGGGGAWAEVGRGPSEGPAEVPI